MAQPWRFWLKTIESQHRIRVASELAEVVPWLNPQPSFQGDCLGSLGAAGQFQISKNQPAGDVLSDLASSLATSPAQPVESGAEWRRLARFSSMTWPMRISFEKAGSRFTFVLPEEPRDLGILPSSGQVVVFAVGFIEVWKPKDWLSHVQSASADLRRIVPAVSNELAER
jgi:hypothetical protein